MHVRPSRATPRPLSPIAPCRPVWPLPPRARAAHERTSIRAPVRSVCPRSGHSSSASTRRSNHGEVRCERRRGPPALSRAGPGVSPTPNVRRARTCSSCACARARQCRQAQALVHTRCRIVKVSRGLEGHAAPARTSSSLNSESGDHPSNSRWGARGAGASDAALAKALAPSRLELRAALHAILCGERRPGRCRDGARKPANRRGVR